MITRLAIPLGTIRVLTIWLMISSELANICPNHWAGGNLGDYQATDYRDDDILGD